MSRADQNSLDPLLAGSREGKRFPLRLGVIGHVPHWIGPDGTPWAYEPYVREMRIWADLFSGLRICSPSGEGPMGGNLAPYERSNVQWNPVSYSLVYGPNGSRRRLLQLPRLFRAVWQTIQATDFIHLRSPGHFGLVGAALVRLTRRRSITKWAGENGSYAGERLPARVDRYLQGVPSRLHPVLVYGPPRRRHQIEFLPALMSNDELARARDLTRGRRWFAPWKVLSMGRLEAAKGFDLAIRGLAELKRVAPSIEWRWTLVGDGTRRKQLADLVASCGIADRTELTGPLPFSEVQRRCAESHVVIMPGTKEGWPKVIAEAWAHGAIPVAAASGLAPWILESGRAGVLFEPTAERLSEALSKLLSDPVRMQTLSEKVFGLADSLSLEQFRFRLERVLVERCGLA